MPLYLDSTAITGYAEPVAEILQGCCALGKVELTRTSTRNHETGSEVGS